MLHFLGYLVMIPQTRFLLRSLHGMIYLLNWQGHSWSFITVVVVVGIKGLSDVIITKQVTKQKSA